MSYLGKAPGAPGGVRQVYEFVATAGQTTFSGADRNGATLSYDPGFANVFVGGVMLSQADVTATNGSSIVLLSGVPAGKIVQIEAFGTFKVADALTIAGGAVNSYLTTPTAPQFDNTKKLATTAFVQRAIGNFATTVPLSGATTLAASDAGKLLQLSGTGPYTVTLPAASAVPTGCCFYFFATTGPVTVTRSGTDVFQATALTSYVLNNGDSLIVEGTGTAWNTVGGSAQLPSATVMSGANWTTPAQFDNGSKLATTAFVKRALGNRAGFAIYSTNTQLTNADIGKYVFFNGTGITLTLPDATQSIPGSVISLYGNSAAGTLNIAAFAGQKLTIGSLGQKSTFTLGMLDSITFVNIDGMWYGLDGSAFNGGSSAFTALQSVNGYQKLPGGMILQWGMASANNAVATQTNAVTFPTAFPTNPVMVLTDHVGGVSSVNTIVVSGTVTTTGFSWGSDYVGGSMSVFWMALGY